MNKKIKSGLEIFFIILLVLFSFYYTDKVIGILESKDPIMRQLKMVNSKKERESVDAVITNNKIVPGYNGVKIDLEKSYLRMKSYGNYNESLMVFKEVKPIISIDDYYDKYIASGNGLTSSVSLVFTLTDSNKTVLDFFSDFKIPSTFFVSIDFLDNNMDFVKTLANNGQEMELLPVSDVSLFNEGRRKLESLTNLQSKYCYATYDDEAVLNLCSRQRMHTIIPTIRLNNNIYSNLKGNLRSGSIINITPSDNNLKEMIVVVNYIKQRGFKLVSLDTLLNEGVEEK